MIIRTEKDGGKITVLSIGQDVEAALESHGIDPQTEYTVEKTLEERIEDLEQ